MKILMVTHYPPQHCGIGSYAEQSVLRLRREGHLVNLLTPPEGDGDFVEDLLGDFNLLKIRKYHRYYDRVIVQYCPSFYFVPYDRPGSAWSNQKACLAFWLLPHFIPDLSIICHEELYYSTSEIGWRSAWMHRLKWLSHKQVYFHTRREREAFVRHIRPINPEGRCLLRPHGGDFFKYRDISRLDARRELGIASNAQVFLCIGFIQPHKGFDRAARAFLQTTHPNAFLYIVGSLRLDYSLTRDYCTQLEALAAQSDGRIRLVQKFISNEEFDTWLSACDYVVAPYKEVWSSSVLARAKLFGKPVIASKVGGLEEQIGEGDCLFESEDELINLFYELTNSELKVFSRQGHLILKKGAREVELDGEDFRKLLTTLKTILTEK